MLAAGHKRRGVTKARGQASKMPSCAKLNGKTKSRPTGKIAIKATFHANG